MPEYFIFYAEANLVCFLIFGVMLLRDHFSMDKQEQQLKFDRALVALSLYFASDTFWAAVMAGVIPKNLYTMAAANFLNYIILAFVTYAWLHYVMAFEHVPNRNKKLNKFAILFPFLIVTLALTIVFIVSPRILIGEKLEPTIVHNIFMISVPIVYICATMFHSFKKARTETTRIGRRKHYFVGVFMLLLLAGGLVQTFVLPMIPVLCFVCTILMLIFYIQSMEKQISIDPLTGLNNRGQLLRYMMQEFNARKEERKRAFVVMIDANGFKSINDTYGHAEGDHALVIIAESLKKVTKASTIPSFLGRYGGDEFILIAHPNEEKELDDLIAEIRRVIRSRCETENTPYMLTIGAGYDEFLGGQDTVQKCMQRADHKLYLDKEYSKLNAEKTA